MALSEWFTFTPKESKENSKKPDLKIVKDEEPKVLADNLGMKLGRITAYWEGGNNYYGDPRMTTMEMSVDGLGGMNKAIAPSLPTGENLIRSQVNISFELE